MRGDEFFAEVSTKPPFTKLHPKVAAFFKDYLSKEKVIRFGGRFVVNTHFPPLPSRAFDNLVEGFSSLGDAGRRRLYSVTLAVTNRCTYRCWHCYNAGRSQTDLPLATWQRLAADLQHMGAVMVTLTGGEPLLRDDLEEIAALFDERCCLILGTTGAGLTPQRARRLRDAGLFGVGISLDSAVEADHDRLRGQTGAFRTAVDALRIAAENDLYPYVVSVATHAFLDRDHFASFMRFAAESGAREVHLLEPSATGRLAGRDDVLLSAVEKRLVLDYQHQVAADDALPILSSYAYLEAEDAFGCGAGLTHLYVDGSGEVSPCQLVPLSFGNVAREPLAGILDRMGSHFRQPRAGCVGHLLAGHLPANLCPSPPELSAEICRHCLPGSHALPRFFQIRAEAQDEVGRVELVAAYNRVHDEYDDFWLTEAAKPIEELLRRLAQGTVPIFAQGTVPIFAQRKWDCPPSCPPSGRAARLGRVFEAGCGTGFATALLAEQAHSVVAVDVSEGMLGEARRRLQARGIENVGFVLGDALEILEQSDSFDLVFSSWVLGYIPLRPFFAAASRRLSRGGRLAFVVHKENSPREPMEIFARLVARDPTVLLKRVAFDFPRDRGHVEAEMATARLGVEELWEGDVVFRYDTPDDVLKHLLKSGAGTAFYDAIDPTRRESLTGEFLERLADGRQSGTGYEVSHEYVACIAVRS